MSIVFYLNAVIELAQSCCCFQSAVYSVGKSVFVADVKAVLLFRNLSEERKYTPFVGSETAGCKALFIFVCYNSDGTFRKISSYIFKKQLFSYEAR